MRRSSGRAGTWPSCGSEGRAPASRLGGRQKTTAQSRENMAVDIFFPECVARVPVSFGGLGVRLCSRKVVSMFATVRERPPATATVCGSAISSPQWRVRQEWSRKRVKLTRVAAVLLVFAEEVSMRVICVAAVILVFAEELSVRVSCVAAFILVSEEEVSV